MSTTESILTLVSAKCVMPPAEQFYKTTKVREKNGNQKQECMQFIKI